MRMIRTLAVASARLARTMLVVPDLTAIGKLDPPQPAGIELLSNTLWMDPSIGGVGSFVTETASWAAFAATIFIVAAAWMCWYGRRNGTFAETV